MCYFPNNDCPYKDKCRVATDNFAHCLIDEERNAFLYELTECINSKLDDYRLEIVSIKRQLLDELPSG